MTNSSIALTLSLLFAHLMGDFLFQPMALVKNKGKLIWLILHGLINGVLVFFVVGNWSFWLPPLIVAASHILIDAGKWLITHNRPRYDSIYLFVIDQILHILTLFIVFLIFYYPQDVTPFWMIQFPSIGYQTILILSGAIVLLPLGGILIGYFMKPFQNQLHKKFNPNSLHPIEGLKEGGKFIGFLERSLIFVFILSGQFAGVGFLIAAKSIFRFGELKDSENRKQAEYIIIGTFASFLLAILVSLTIQTLLRFPII